MDLVAKIDRAREGHGLSPKAEWTEDCHGRDDRRQVRSMRVGYANCAIQYRRPDSGQLVICGFIGIF